MATHTHTQILEWIIMIFSDSLSALQVLDPLLTQIQDMLHKNDGDYKEIVSMWVPGHDGIHRNEAADTAAKEALDKEPTQCCTFLST